MAESGKGGGLGDSRYDMIVCFLSSAVECEIHGPLIVGNIAVTA